jgi:hypothetical protein
MKGHQMTAWHTARSILTRSAASLTENNLKKEQHSKTL